MLKVVRSYDMHTTYICFGFVLKGNLVYIYDHFKLCLVE